MRRVAKLHLSHRIRFALGGILFAMGVAATNAQAASGARVAVVLSSDLAPYRQAFDSFRTHFTEPISVLHLTPNSMEVPKDVQIVVAFGSKAALAHYPAGTILICAMAPGIRIDSARPPAAVTQIAMVPSASALLVNLKVLQPSLRRLAILGLSQPIERYIDDLKSASASLGITIVSLPQKHLTDLPSTLRSLPGRVDALWIPPDPFFITNETLFTLKNFSEQNKLPLYLPTAGLVGKGAAAVVSCSYAEIGRTTAWVAKQALEGESLPAIIYPEKTSFVVNRSVAERSGLEIPENVLRGAEQVLP